MDSPERRIDVTLAVVAEMYDAMSENARARLSDKPWLNTIVAVSRIRAMERAEEEALGRPSKGLADAYDRLVIPGEPAVPALLRTFSTLYGQSR